MLSSTIGMRLFSTLDDGTGYTPAEYILDAWIEEGIENSAEILQVRPQTFLFHVPAVAILWNVWIAAPQMMKRK